jgi:cell division protein YceG involved in septum cleavage
MKKIIIPFTVILFLAGFCLYILSGSTRGQDGQVFIQEKDGAGEIYENCTGTGLLDRSWRLRVTIWTLSPLPGCVEAGWYDLEGGEPLYSFWWRFFRGERKSVTVRPGDTQEEILYRLGRCMKKDFPVMEQALEEQGLTLEGMLYPGEYPCRHREAAPMFQDMLDAFVRASRSGGYTRHDIILASVIQKSGLPWEHYPDLAALYANRLEKGIPLCSKATRRYAENHGLPPVEYDTCVRKGLPPTPVCSPGEAALEAAHAPPDRSWLDYQEKKDGSLRFSESLIRR